MPCVNDRFTVPLNPVVPGGAKYHCAVLPPIVNIRKHTATEDVHSNEKNSKPTNGFTHESVFHSQQFTSKTYALISYVSPLFLDRVYSSYDLRSMHFDPSSGCVIANRLATIFPCIHAYDMKNINGINTTAVTNALIPIVAVNVCF